MRSTGRGLDSRYSAISFASGRARAFRFRYFRWCTASRAIPRCKKSERTPLMAGGELRQFGQSLPPLKGTAQHPQYGGVSLGSRLRHDRQRNSPSAPHPMHRRGKMRSRSRSLDCLSAVCKVIACIQPICAAPISSSRFLAPTLAMNCSMPCWMLSRAWGSVNVAVPT